MNTDAKLQAFEELLNEVSGGLADMVKAMQDVGANNPHDAIANGIADLLKLLEKRGRGDLGELVKEVRALRETPPQVSVNVLPAPVHFMPALQHSEQWSVVIKGVYGAPDREMQITKTTTPRIEQ